MKLPRLNVVQNIKDNLIDNRMKDCETLLKQMISLIDTRHRNDPVLWHKISSRAQAILPDFSMSGLCQLLYCFEKGNATSPILIDEVVFHLLEEYNKCKSGELSLWNYASVNDLCSLAKILTVNNTPIDTKIFECLESQLSSRKHLLIPDDINMVLAAHLRYSNKHNSLIFSPEFLLTLVEEIPSALQKSGRLTSTSVSLNILAASLLILSELPSTAVSSDRVASIAHSLRVLFRFSLEGAINLSTKDLVRLSKTIHWERELPCFFPDAQTKNLFSLLFTQESTDLSLRNAQKKLLDVVVRTRMKGGVDGMEVAELLDLAVDVQKSLLLADRQDFNNAAALKILADLTAIQQFLSSRTASLRSSKVVELLKSNAKLQEMFLTEEGVGDETRTLSSSKNAEDASGNTNLEESQKSSLKLKNTCKTLVSVYQGLKEAISSDLVYREVLLTREERAALLSALKDNPVSKEEQPVS
eukprot:GDKJ01022928.1.p1 GENE.GDKJ01022928.1~~GDKJ01022928.1.p1  ORF type:complete len:480 (-),score=92.40 GDKJ01022928.1:65-1480(-)